ncbi:MAG: SDR family NAD(P)-dependent oxidoreductase [Actinomycetota bacterium]
MKRALITGASRGFGKALADSLWEHSLELIVDGRNEQTLHEAFAGRTRVTTIPGDVADPSHRHVLQQAVGDSLHLLVNNASDLGVTPLRSIATYPITALTHVLQINTVAPLALIQAVLPALRASNGIIVNITSDAAVESYPGWGGYGASKAALDHISATLAAEEHGISVYSFDPGDMRTQMHQAAFPGEDISDRPLPETIVPALLELIGSRPSSGRYRASDFLAKAPA